MWTLYVHIIPKEISGYNNDKYYFGITSREPSIRWGSNGINYRKLRFGNAIKKCCAFVWDIFRMCDASSLFYDGKKTAYCPTVVNWGISKKLDIKDKTKGQYGDIVIFDWGKDGIGDHIGFIEKNKGNGVYDCIEGNTAVGNDSNGGCVMRRERNVSQIQCIIRPKYEIEDTTNAKITKVGNLFKNVNTWDGVVCSLSEEDKITFKTDFGNGWSKVDFKGQLGFVKNSHIKMNDKTQLSSYPTRKAIETVAFRKERKVDKLNKISEIKPSETFTLLAKDNKWAYVEYKNKKGYVWKEKTNVK